MRVAPEATTAKGRRSLSTHVITGVSTSNALGPAPPPQCATPGNRYNAANRSTVPPPIAPASQ